MNRKEQGEKHSLIMKEKWKDPAFREKSLLILSKIRSSPSFKNKVSENMRKNWKNLEYRNNRSGPNNKGWKGGKYIAKNGYVRVRNSPWPKPKQRYTMEHRLVMEKELGRLRDEKRFTIKTVFDMTIELRTWSFGLNNTHRE